MVSVEKSIEIKAPPEKVWEMFAFDRLPEWDSGFQKDVESVELISDVNTPEDKYRVGTSVGINNNRGKQGVMEITESLENEKLVYRFDAYNAILTYTLKPVETGTRFTSEYDYELPYGTLGKLFGKLVAERMSVKAMEKSLENLKSILEK